MSGTEVTVRDVETGESETTKIVNDWIVVADGDCFISNVQSYPKTGTAVVTIKRLAASRPAADTGGPS